MNRVLEAFRYIAEINKLYDPTGDPLIKAIVAASQQDGQLQMKN
jgi:hypothetical protein